MKRLTYSEVPSSIYRLQFNEQFTLKKAIKILPYLYELGIEGVYCSPFYDSYQPHGYDVTDPNQLNPKIGTLEEYQTFCEELKRLGMKQVIDVVPNHMGIRGGKNRWWQDVLENGPYSLYASFFDIDWNPEKKELHDRILLPILSQGYGDALEKGEIHLSFENGEFFAHIKDFPLPLAPHTYPNLLEIQREELKTRLGEDSPEWKAYLELINFYHTFPLAPEERPSKKEEGKAKLSQLAERAPDFKAYIDQVVILFNGNPNDPSSFDRLDQLLESQFYRLSYWRVANEEINYRRFFNIHELVALRIELEEVLKKHHRWIFELVEKGDVQGLRIDHPDGLYDPVTYFERIHRHFPVFLIVEKILDEKENLPANWQVEGTVGYEYLILTSGLFIQPDSEKAFTKLYREFTGTSTDFEEILYKSKKYFAAAEMASEMNRLGLQLDRLAERDRHTRDFTHIDLTRALIEVIAHFPVYRTYLGIRGEISERDRKYLDFAIEKAMKRSPLDPSIFTFLKRVLSGELFSKEEGYRDFVLRFQQITAPVVAKGLEDTSFYIYNRFISLNEVGGNPKHFGTQIDEFHQFNLHKQEAWPLGFLASSTHDSKRNEDVRMRLNVLSEIPQHWKEAVHSWAEINKPLHQGALDPNIEYFIYQTLVGIWPTQGESREGLNERIWNVIQKSMREAKQVSNWRDPNQTYEEFVQHFIDSILHFETFLNAFTTFHQKIDYLGRLNSLSLAILKMGSCGIVDLYQGNEIFHYTLVDPDNRREVDYEKRSQLLRQVMRAPQVEPKLFLQSKALTLRRQYKKLFLDGEYIPLEVRGKRKNHVIAFARIHEGVAMVIVVGRFFASLIEKGSLHSKIWEGTEIILPEELALELWEDLFTEKKIEASQEHNRCILPLAKIWNGFTVSFLKGYFDYTQMQ